MLRSRAFWYVSNVFESQTKINVSLPSPSRYSSLYSVSLPLPRSLYSALSPPQILAAFKPSPSSNSSLLFSSLSMLRSILSLSLLPRSLFFALFRLSSFFIALFTSYSVSIPSPAPCIEMAMKPAPLRATLKDQKSFHIPKNRHSLSPPTSLWNMAQGERETLRRG